LQHSTGIIENLEKNKQKHMLMASPAGRPSVRWIPCWPALLAVRSHVTTATKIIRALRAHGGARRWPVELASRSMRNSDAYSIQSQRVNDRVMMNLLNNEIFELFFSCIILVSFLIKSRVDGYSLHILKKNIK
jgi:hypothetical protein